VEDKIFDSPSSAAIYVRKKNMIRTL
jgi:hypothetical protein